jgi:hypothetical protein
MDSNVDAEKPSAIAEQYDNEAITPDTQINPLTMMTSLTTFNPVDDKQENALASIDVNLPQGQSAEPPLSLSLNPDVSSPNIFVSSSSNIADQKLSSNIHMDNRAIAAWVETTTTEAMIGTLERSPSLPSTLLEPMIIRSRRDSNVSTICDQQQSIISDTLTSQQLSCSNDIQRSLSMPLNDQHHRNDGDNEQLINSVNEDDEDMSTKFLPVPESEESEAEKKTKQVSSADEEPIKFEGRSPTTRESPKKSPNVSFHASVSFEAHHKPSVSHRKRRTSWNTNKTKPPSFQRSQSHIATSQPPSLHSQILRKQFRSALSMPNGTIDSAGDTTRQSSSLSDNVFYSSSTTNSSLIRNHPPFFKDNRFLAIPSSASVLSSGRNTSIISDASGRSGIESTNLDASPSDQLGSLSIENEGSILHRPVRNSPASTTSSATASTQSLSSSSDDELNTFTKKMKDLHIDKTTRKTSTDKRRDVLNQLMWLSEKKPSLYAKFGHAQRKPSSPTKPQQKSTPNPFVEVK